MRLAVISDIHGNLEAFEAVLEDIDANRIDAVISLGDNIGYGAEPEKVMQLLMKRRISSVMGNHEMAIADEKYLNWFNPVARKAAVMTAKWLSEDSREFILSLKPCMQAYDCWFVHAFPPDSVTRYIFQASDHQLSQIIARMKKKIIFVGHTHTLELISFDGTDLVHESLKQEIVQLNSGRQYLINVGSVGQPRDDDNHAKYVIWDSERQTVEARYVRYDNRTAAQKIIDAGLPRQYAERLY